jgi:hypothetical protein
MPASALLDSLWRDAAVDPQEREAVLSLIEDGKRALGRIVTSVS